MDEKDIELYHIPVVTKTSANLSNYPLHKHHYWEILYYTKSSGHLRLKDNPDIAFDVGTVICVPPNMLHGSESDTAFENICIIDPEFPLSDSNANLCIVTHDNCENDLSSLFAMAFRSFIDNQPGCSGFIRHILSCIYDIVQYNMKQMSASDNIAGQIKKSIIKNFSSPSFSVNEIIGSNGYSCNYIREVFKKMTGMTPTGYLNSLRLKNAEWLLLYNPEYSVSEVALRSGFNDPLYFSKLFHKAFGVAPKTYRKSKISDINMETTHGEAKIRNSRSQPRNGLC